MATDNVEPELRRRLAKIEDDIRMLFNRKQPISSALADASFPLVASFPGANVTGSKSVPYYHDAPPVDFQVLRISRPIAGAADVEATVTVNGSTLYVPTLVAGAVTATFAVAFSLATGSLYEVELTDAGDGVDVSVSAGLGV